MKLIPWKKRAELFPLRYDADDFWSRFFDPFENGGRLPETFKRRSLPPVNLAETEQDVIVTAELPGLDEKDIELEIMGDHLRIAGERKWEEEKKEKDYHRIESEFGSFERSVQLPAGLRLDPEAVEASYDKGVLTVRVPKVEPTPTKRIPIQVG